MIRKTLAIFQFSTLKLVIVRHGESECNQIKRWSGWYDASLTPKGQEDALECAKHLQKEGFTFDTAYCSYLSRTINTLDIMVGAMNLRSIPIKKRWQLN